MFAQCSILSHCQIYSHSWTRQYFFIGCHAKSVIVWNTAANNTDVVRMLPSDREPSKAQISQYQKVPEQIRWNEDYARKRLEGC